MNDKVHKLGVEIIEDYFADRFAISNLNETFPEEGKTQEDDIASGIFRSLDVEACWIESDLPKQWLVKYVVDPNEMNGVFIETLCSDTQGMKQNGWAWASKAQILVYYIPKIHIMYLSNLVSLRFAIHDWFSYEVKSFDAIRNGRECMLKGMLVPFDTFKKVCIERVVLPTLIGGDLLKS